jgi:hypothetical protein
MFRQIRHRTVELLLNDRLLGEYDFVFGIHTNYNLVSPSAPQPSGQGKFVAAYPQPDGSLFFYVIKDNRLFRLRAMPQPAER